MSRYASKAELIGVIKQTIETDYNKTGLPTDLGAYNFAGIMRDLGVGGDSYYGWITDYGVDFEAVLLANLRPAYRGLPRAHRAHVTFAANNMDDPPPRDGTHTAVCPCTWTSGPYDRPEPAEAAVAGHIADWVPVASGSVSAEQGPAHAAECTPAAGTMTDPVEPAEERVSHG